MFTFESGINIIAVLMEMHGIVITSEDILDTGMCDCIVLSHQDAPDLTRTLVLKRDVSGYQWQEHHRTRSHQAHSGTKHRILALKQCNPYPIAKNTRRAQRHH